jgi:hypothetical protein
MQEGLWRELRDYQEQAIRVLQDYVPQHLHENNHHTYCGLTNAVMYAPNALYPNEDPFVQNRIRLTTLWVLVELARDDRPWTSNPYDSQKVAPLLMSFEMGANLLNVQTLVVLAIQWLQQRP